jgi:hypothetical protein
MKTIKTLVIGFGQIGKSVYNVLHSEGFDVHARDTDQDPILNDIDVLHICFPYTENFVKCVKKYKKLYKPKYTIIHSTVPVGTTTKCKCFYSPVRGIHPHLENSLKTFVKYLAPRNEYLKSYFAQAGITVEETDKTETLEAMKLYCTTIYALNVIAEKEMWEFCKKHDIDYNIVYTESNKTYNEGYSKLGFPQYTRYMLKHTDGKIGGHCLIPNCKLLKTDISKFILKQNDKL